VFNNGKSVSTHSVTAKYNVRVLLTGDDVKLDPNIKLNGLPLETLSGKLHS
jgi:hypothetical protein